MSDISNKESKGDIKDKLESTDLSNISIYSIDRDLEIGDIVYGYLTNPFKAKIDIIKPNYPFKVIGKSETELFLLGQCSVFISTWKEMFALDLINFYVHFLHNGESYKFNAHVPTIEDLYQCSLDDLKIRDINKYWIRGTTTVNFRHFYVKDGHLDLVYKDSELGIVPFVTVSIKKRV